jgi:hypothetical protein
MRPFWRVCRLALVPSSTIDSEVLNGPLGDYFQEVRPFCSARKEKGQMSQIGVTVLSARSRNQRPKASTRVAPLLQI